jgi:uncharacterized DUF497 family protein
MLQFEFDTNKGRANKQKHGIDFVGGQALWEDLDLLEIKAKTVDEERLLEIGKIGGKFWTAVITHRGQRIRIISIRQSHMSERKLYESTGI